MALLGDRLAGLVTGSKDTLILYVSAHGVSGEGEAYLLCSDFLFHRRKVAGRYRLGDLLEQIKRCPARLKLLILDDGRIAHDPRLGMIVNEFPRLLESKLQEVEDPSRWVLAARGPLERSHFSQDANRSIFSWFVAEGLSGKADTDGDGMVEMAELFDFARQGVGNWVYQESDTRRRQTVHLFHDGQTDPRPPEELDILKASRPARENEPDEETADLEGKDEPESADEPDTSSTDAASARLRAAWRLRDDVRQRKGPGGWSPVDYAPHLWRKYEETLVAYEQRYWSGRAFPPEKLVEDVETKLLPAKELLLPCEQVPGLEALSPEIRQTPVLGPLLAGAP